MGKLDKKYLVIAVGAIVVLGAVFAVVQIMTPDSATKTPAVSKPNAQTTGLGREQTLYEKADTLKQQGKYAEAQKLLDDAQAASTDKKVQGQLLEDQALLAYNNADYTKALEYARAAEAKYPTRTTASMIARCSEALGDKPTAVEYYKLTIKRTDAATKQRNPSSVSEYEAKIKELSAP